MKPLILLALCLSCASDPSDPEVVSSESSSLVCEDNLHACMDTCKPLAGVYTAQHVLCVYCCEAANQVCKGHNTSHPGVFGPAPCE